MADQFLTLKDATALGGYDKLVGVIDAVVNVAPEIDRVIGRPIPDTYFDAAIRTAIGTASTFRRINSGVALSAAKYDLKRFECFPFDIEMRIDELLIEKLERGGQSMGQTFTNESVAAMKQKALALGKQFYNGTTNDAYGPPGLVDFITTQRKNVDSRSGGLIDQTVDAGGTVAGKCENVWLFDSSPQGVHWLFGAGRGLIQVPFFRQQVTSQDSAGKAMAWVSSVNGWIGTACPDIHLVGCVANVDAYTQTTPGTYDHPLTDKLIATLFAKFPVGKKPKVAFASQNAIASLQYSRTVTLFANAAISGERNSGGAAPIAPWPTDLPTAGGIPIIPTDSIPLGNRNTAIIN